MTHGKVHAVFGAVVAVSLLGAGCATKKHVREAIAPVQNQVNDVQKQTQDNRQAIGDLDRQVATADEKATDAGKRANAAADAAQNAHNAANQARQQADSATSLAQQAQQGVSSVDQRVERFQSQTQSQFQNLDNYKLAGSQQVYFRTNASSLSKDDQQKLDQVVQDIGGKRNYVIEVEGFADHTGNKAYNMDLSRKRADAVVNYLVVQHDVPLRAIREIGAGADFPNASNRTAADRRENRRVDVKVYTLDLTGTAQALNDQGNPNRSDSQADRQRNTPQTP